MGNKLYVGNLAYETTEGALSSLFGEVGEVSSVSLITDRTTGQSKGFAFVEMAESSTAEEAINRFNGKGLDGRNIKVNKARPKNEDSNPWGGGGGRRRHF
jgi:cold-inducible RNA-binding protein